MSQLTERLSASMGGVQKAILIIHREDAEEIDTEEVSEQTQQALEKATVDSVLENMPAGTSAEKLYGGLTTAGLDVAILQVQYNPDSLTIQANADPIPFTYLQANVDSGIPNQNLRPPMVVLGVELIFDATNPQDAFMMDKFRISAGSVVSDIAGGIQAKKGGYTVQPQTEALIAALLQEDTRVVTFRWGDMAFTGQLYEVRADYTMFSVSGRPIRSKVSLNISQQVESQADMKYWDKAMGKVFKESNNVELKKTGQQLGNLLNLDLF